jgi:hypothetical protein
MVVASRGLRQENGKPKETGRAVLNIGGKHL